MGAISFAVFKPRIPRLHIRQRRPVDLKLEITVKLRACRDIAEGKRVASDEGTALEMLVEQTKQDGTAGNALADQRPVPLRLRRAIEIPEHAARESRLKVGQRPIRPHVALCALSGVGGPERLGSIFCREI